MGFWNGLAGPSRRMIVSAVVIFGVGLVLLMRLSGSVSYATLNEQPLEAAEAKAAADQLTALGIPYRFTDGGASIQVPTDQRTTASMELRAAQALGGGGGPGWEIFDKSSLGATDFTQRVNLVRAMEGELSRTIGRLEPVQSAIVKIAMPQERLFTSEQQPTTASVVLTLAPGALLEPGQVKGITRLVAMSIPGLKTEDITVTDSSGNILEGGTEATGATAADTRMAIQRRYERETQGRLDAMLAAILGPGKAVTQVHAVLDLDKVTTESETFDDESATPLDRETSRERLQSEGGTAAGGRAGATANTPGAAPFAAGAAGNTDYSKTTERSRIGVDHTRSTIERTPGTIQRQAISVQVSDDVPAETVASLEEAVSAAVGFQQGRDQISVQAVPFSEEGAAARAATTPPAATPPPAGAPFDPMSLLKPGLAGLGVLVLLFLSRRSLRRRQTALERALPELLAKGPVSLAELGAPAAALGAPTEPIAQLEGQRKTPVEQQMEDLAKRKPDDVAQLLRGWLVEGR